MSETQGGDDWRLASDGKWYPLAAGSSEPAAKAKPWWKRKRIVVAGGVAVVILAVATTGGTDSDEPAGPAVAEQSDTEQSDAAQFGADDDDTANNAATTEEADPTTDSTATTAAPETTSTTTAKPFDPIKRNGEGNDVIVFDEPVDMALIARLSHIGSSNFQVTLFGEDGDRVGSIANVIGDWSGEVPVNFQDGERFSLMEVTADGTWSVSFDSVLSATIAGTASGDTYAGSGSQVLLFSTDGPTVIDVDCPSCDSNVQITAYSDRRDGVANEIGDGGYAASHLIPAGTILLHVNMAPNFDRATPDWTITVQ